MRISNIVLYCCSNVNVKVNNIYAKNVNTSLGKNEAINVNTSDRNHCALNTQATPTIYM